jgi:hypothetical protein
MAQKLFVRTNIYITKEQHDYLKSSPYNMSALARITLKNIMENEK